MTPRDAALDAAARARQAADKYDGARPDQVRAVLLGHAERRTADADHHDQQETS